MFALLRHPIELGDLRIIVSEELLVDGGEHRVQLAGGLLSALTKPMGLVHNQQVEMIRAVAHFEW
jgi:hypothetical protein